MMDKLQPLTALEKAEAEKNHNLVYSFLNRYGFSIEEYYDVVIFGYLRGIQTYYRRKDLQEKYDLPLICFMAMKSAVGNHFRYQNARKRKPDNAVISLDADYAESDNLHNCISGKNNDLVSEMIEAELLAELMENLSDIQRKIVQRKIDGYTNKKTYLMLEIKPSTYYKEMKRIKTLFEEIIA